MSSGIADGKMDNLEVDCNLENTHNNDEMLGQNLAMNSKVMCRQQCRPATKNHIKGSIKICLEEPMPLLVLSISLVTKQSHPTTCSHSGEAVSSAWLPGGRRRQRRRHRDSSDESKTVRRPAAVT